MFISKLLHPVVGDWEHYDAGIRRIFLFIILLMKRLQSMVQQAFLFLQESMHSSTSIRSYDRGLLVDRVAETYLVHACRCSTCCFAEKLRFCSNLHPYVKKMGSAASMSTC
jgi:hypothetical protein